MKKSKKKKIESKFLEIYLALYCCSVLVTWEQDINKVIKKAKKRGVQISKEWEGSFSECREGAGGVCLSLGDKNTDVLVWLKERPRKASQFGILYHELYHSVDHISKSHNLADEWEARAYIFEFLVNQCNRSLWV